MEKHHNNRGFSLVEVLVAIAILAIVSIPIIKSFSVAAKLNKNARQVENATSLSQIVSEDFKSLSIDELTAKYSDYTVASSSGVYVFSIYDTVDEDGNKYYKGTNNEKYNVSVKLNPGIYRDNIVDGDNENNNINSYDMPSFASLDKDNNMVIRDQLNQWDLDALETFSIQSGSNVTRSDVVKETNIVVTFKDFRLDEDGSTYSATQNVEINVCYKCSKNNVPDYVRSIVKSSNVKDISVSNPKITKSNGLKNVYLFYAPFDTYSDDTIPESTDLYASDKISLDYSYSDSYVINGADIMFDFDDLNVYLVEQNVLSADNTKKVRLKNDNVTIKINGNEVAKTIFGTTKLDDVKSGAGPVNFYSNVYKWDSYVSSNDKKNGITVNNKRDSEDKLYEIEVYVELDGKQLVKELSTKEN